MTGVKRDRNALVCSALFDNIVGKSLGRTAHRIDIHTIDPCSDDSAKSCGTKLQVHIETFFDLVFIVRDCAKLFFRLFVKVRIGKPFLVDLHVILHVLTPLMHYFLLAETVISAACNINLLYYILDEK